MIKIGMSLGDRYEIEEKIGTGGMSDVYKAKDFKLNRYVAVKVLKQEFSENANFVSRFRVEAQAAAGLMHPNVVNVYDVGEEDGINYIVMELVEGITLKKYIEKKARLSFKEAVSIAIQVSMGIEAAHNNKIIHRDIKPQNIIISRDGKVKVTDFGIAKAATSNTITSNVMGSVHYTSPEQARGGYSDEKSDIYSLGVTLFEMLTGRVPYNGETTVAIAIKHIQEEMPHPIDFVDDIPLSVDGIVVKCCQKNPDKRYASVGELLADLKKALLSPDDDVTSLGAGETRKYGKGLGDVDGTSNEKPEKNSHKEGIRINTGEKNRDEDRNSEKIERVTLIVVIVAAVVILGIIVFLLWKIFMGFDTQKNPIAGTEPSPTPTVVQTQTPSPEIVKSVELPNLIGLDVNTAVNNLNRVHIDYELEYTDSDTVEENLVMLIMDEDRMVLNAGDKIREDAKVILEISAGVALVEVPGVENMEYTEAYNALVEAGFLVQKDEKNSDEVPEGYVISQTPKALSEASPSTIVKITISLGPKVVQAVVPNLLTMTEEDATIVAIENNLKIGSITYVFDSEYEAGTVCYQSIKEGSSVVNGSSIDLRISQGVRKTYYKCNLSIVAPTTSETKHYTADTPVDLKLVSDDGNVLLETTIKSFPSSVNYSGIESNAGTLYMSFKYTETTDEVVKTDENGNSVVVTPAGSVEKTESISRRIDFVQE